MKEFKEDDIFSNLSGDLYKYFPHVQKEYLKWRSDGIIFMEGLATLRQFLRDYYKGRYRMDFDTLPDWNSIVEQLKSLESELKQKNNKSEEKHEI